ncbi:cadherin-like beta sandwich domain-containing protein [Phenylobacterium soli]|uniref:Autotransporter domain-containing protein n=1 Tax=Phenylobacterium soli TaxID=2170551 RepID=A0A328AJG8_9CAUL|nr:cadherin-like beta sandwich domain-containing protein [Phenylobacterium soli]RAK54216.1 hypothetical protein DJ017_06610 [Phenylobacterium soli]
MFGVLSHGWSRLCAATFSGSSRVAAVLATAFAVVALAAPGVALAVPSSNANLSSLDVGGLTLSPSFAAATTSYTATAPSATASVMVTAVTADANATITVDVVNPATSGVAYGPVSLNFGNTTIGVQVTAQDGTTTKTYQVTIYRPVGGGGGGASTDATLSGLTLSAGTLSPSFAAATTSYTASVANAVSSITVTPTLNDPTASMTVNGSAVTSGSASGSIALNVGANTITVATTAQDGVTTNSYVVTVTRASASLTAQTITFANPGGQNFGTTPTFVATSDSGLTVSFSSSTTGVCTITSGGVVTFLTAGNCTINADQAGNGTYAAATTVSRTVTVFPVAPGAPTIGAVTPGDTQASVAFTAPAFTGGDTITGYTATSSPGGLTGTCASSPCTVTGLTNGTAYTFTVTATNSAGTGSASAASSGATPKASQTITFANPGAQNFGTTPTLTATSSSGLTPTFSSSTTGVCTVTSGGALTFVTAGSCTIAADQAGNGGYLAATTVSRTFTVNPVVPGAPTIGAVTPGNGQVGVAFTAPASNGGSGITGYTVTSSPGGFTGTGASSPITVSGLTNGTSYTFTVTASNSAGTGSASSPSASATPAVASTDATLSGLTLSSGTLSPAFAGGTTSYTASVANGTASITVTPTVNESHATVKVNGTTVTSGSASNAVALNVGSNTVTVLVTAQDGTTTTTYTLTVTRADAPPPDLDLSDLQVTTGDSSSPGAPVPLERFSAMTSYGRVKLIVTSVTVSARPPPGAHLTINGQGGSTPPGAAVSVVVPLNRDDNTITIVTSAGTFTKTYIVYIKRMVTDNADLRSVKICGKTYGCSSTAVDPATTSYTIPAVGTLTIWPTPADGTARVEVNGAPASPTSSIQITAPATAVTPVAIKVTSNDYTVTKTYTFTFSAPKPSADLSALGVSAGTLSPDFDPAKVSYDLPVSSDTASVTLSPTAKDGAASVRVINVASGQPVSGPVALRAGAANPLSVTVTASDKSTAKTYYVNVSRPNPLTVEAYDAPATGKVGVLYEAGFQLGTSQGAIWSASGLPPGLSLTENASPTSRPSTSPSSNPKALISGTPAKAGTYTFTVTATANGYGAPLGGATGSASVTVNVAEGPSDVDLTALRLEAGAAVPLSPAFDPATTAYTASTASGQLSIGATPRDSGATVTIDGVQDGTQVSLKPGANVITINVSKGSASKTYTLTVNKVAAGANADLKGLTLGAGATLSTPFAPDTLAYKATVTNATTSLQIAAPTADANATVKFNPAGQQFGQGTTASLQVGDNVFKIAVTSADGTLTKTYTLTVTRAASANADLTNISVVSAELGVELTSKLSPAFSPATTTYSLVLSHGESVIEVGGVAADTNARTAVDSVNSTGYAATQAVSVDDSIDTPKVIPVTVTAQDGTTTKTYSISVTRPAALKVASSVPEATSGQAYSATLAASGGKGPYVFKPAALAGTDSLPKGLTLSSDGTISGTTKEAGSYSIGVSVSDSAGGRGSGTVALAVKDPPTPVPVRMELTVPTLRPDTSGFSTQFVLSVTDAALGTIESHLEANVDVSSSVSSAPTAAALKSGKSAGAPMMATAGQAAASADGDLTLLTYRTGPNAMGRDRIVVIGTLPDGTRGAVALNFEVPGKAPDLTANVAANGLARLDPTASIIGGPFVGLQILSPPAYGQVSVSGLQLVYTPDPTHLGPTSFVYAVDLGFGLSAPGTVTVTTGQGVTAPSLAATAYAGQKVSLDLTAGAQGGPFTGASVISISPSSAGTAAIRATGTGTYALDFTPATSFAGPAKVTYALSGAGGAAIADATITVLARPDPSLNADLRGLISASDQAVKTFARTQTDNFNGRLESLRSARGRGGFDMRLGFAAASSGEDPRDQAGWRTRRLAQQAAPDPTGQSPAGPRASDAPSATTGASGQSPGKPSAFGSWVAGVIQIGHVDPSVQRSRYRLSTSGLSAGVDYRLSDHLVLGAGLGYGENKTRVGSKGSRLDADSKVGAAYGSWLPRPGIFVDGVLGYGKLSFDVTRYSAEADKLLTGSRSGDMTFGSLRAGVDARRGALHVSPYGQVSFLDGRLDSFTETGDGAFALRYYAQDVRSLAASLGLKLEGQRKVGRERTLSPRFRVEWRHEFDGIGDQALSYADTAGSQRYVVGGDQLGRDELSYELGGRLQLEHQIAIDLGYRGMFTESSHSGTWTLRLDHSF